MSEISERTPVGPVSGTAEPQVGTTVRPRPAAGDPDMPAEARRRIATLRGLDYLAVLGAAIASLSLTAVLFTRILPFNGFLGFVVIAYALFVGLYALLVSFDSSGLTVRDRVASVVVHSLGALLLAALVFVIGYTLWRGHKALRHLNFFTQDMSSTGPLQPLTDGGMRHAIVGTLEQITIALAVTVPFALTCAVFLNEVPGAFARFVRTIVEAMTALPSIVAGLFIYATVILTLGVQKSGFAAALALSVMMLPIIIRAADVVLRLVPGSLREASYALGASQWRTVWSVLLPTARSGLTTAVILGTARGIGETSPVLLTAGFADGTNTDPLHGPQVSLPLETFSLVRSPEPNMIARGFAAAALLMWLVLVLFLLARFIGGRAPGDLTRRQEHRRVLASRRDADRMARRTLARASSSAPDAAVIPGLDPPARPERAP